MIKRVVIKDGKKYIINVPSWNDNLPEVEPSLINESDLNNVPIVLSEPETKPQ